MPSGFGANKIERKSVNGKDLSLIMEDIPFNKFHQDSLQ
jgi:hypothetical protein